MAVLNLHQGDFAAEIVLERLHELPNANLRKLQKFLEAEPEKREELLVWLDHRAQETKARWEQASVAFTQGWKLVPNKRARDQKSVDTLRENARLKTEVKRAKALYDRIRQMQTILNKEN